MGVLLILTAHLLRQRLLQGGQGSVCVAGVCLQGLDSVLQVSQLLVFVPQLLLQILNLKGRGAGRSREEAEEEEDVNESL